METMSQFANEKDLWKSRCLRMARALVDGLDDVPDDDLLTHVAEARSDACVILALLAPTDAKAKGLRDERST